MRPDQKRFLLHFGLPAVAAVGLFTTALFAVYIPAFEQTVMERKREMIRELANVAWSTLERYAAEEQQGRLSREQAQREAVRELRHLRYGPEAKDYYWIIDLGPRMVMHPYVPELEGQELGTFADASGKRLFVDQVRATEAEGQAYVEYVWQWKDDPSRRLPKLSYVRRFKGWGWIVGTGLYVDDVRHEIAAVRRSLLLVSSGIAVLVAALLTYLGLQAKRTELSRLDAEASLRDSEERYRTLVQAATEGLLMLQDARVTFVNQRLADLLGWAPEELMGRSAAEIIKPATEASPDWVPEPGTREMALLRKDGSAIDVLLSVSSEAMGSGTGLAVTLRDMTLSKAVEQELDLHRERFLDLTDRLGMGVFRASAGRRWRLLEANEAALALLGIPRERLAETDFFGLVHNRGEANHIQGLLEAGGAVKERVVELELPGRGLRMVSVSLLRTTGPSGRAVLEGLLEDVNDRVREARASNLLMQDLQFSQQSLYSEIRPFAKPVPACTLDTPIVTAAGRMARAQVSAVLTVTETGQPCGIVTDHDIRTRVVAEGLDPAEPVHRIMSAPLRTLPGSALVMEALHAMDEQRIMHLAVADAHGRVEGVLDGRSFLTAYRNIGELVLQEIQRAKEPDMIAAVLARTPGMVRSMLDLGIRGSRISRFLAALGEATTRRCLAWALEATGPAPCPFGFLVLGSLGRGETTLRSDQDNALIFADVHPPEAPGYFQRLAERVNADLEACGYPPCPGGIMARNPRWNAPLSAWQAQFARWIAASEPKDLLDVHIFFDLRTAYGDATLAEALLASLAGPLGEHPAFFAHMANAAMQTRATLGKLGSILTEPGERLDMKNAQAQLTNPVRILALHQGLTIAATLDRLEALRRADPRWESDHLNLVAAHEFLMELRIRAQLQEPPGNLLELKGLSEAQLATLKKVLAQVELLRSRISFDMLGRA